MYFRNLIAIPHKVILEMQAFLALIYDAKYIFSSLQKEGGGWGGKNPAIVRIIRPGF